MFLFLAPRPPQWARASSFTRFVDDTQRRTTVVRIPLGKLSPRHRDLKRTTRNPPTVKTSVPPPPPPVGFEPTVSADERPQTYALDRAATHQFGHYVQSENSALCGDHVCPSVCDLVSATVPVLHILVLYKRRVGVSFVEIGWTVVLRVRT
jgi:hypothetical protein